MKKLFLASTLFLLLGSAFWFGSRLWVRDPTVSDNLQDGHTIPEMISRAEAVVLARIDAIVAPTRDESVSYTNRVVTLSVLETWRGKCHQTFKARVTIDSQHGPYVNHNPSARVGSTALAFVEKAAPAPGKDPQEYLNLFGGQGFMTCADLVRRNDLQTGNKALAALKETVLKYRPHGFFLNDEAAKPLFDLLASDSPELRWWAISRGLGYVRVTPYVAKRLIEALNHDDPEVRKAAARHLMVRRYPAAREIMRKHLQKMSDKDGEFVHEIRRYLQASVIEAHLENMDKELRTRILTYLERESERRKTAVVSLWGLDYRVNERGELRLLRTRFEDREPTLVQGLTQHLQQLDFAKMDILPYRFRPFITLDQGKLTIEVK